MKKFNIIKGREKLSDSEIQKQMNFDKFISGHTPAKGWFPKGIKLYSLITSVSVALVAAAYIVFQPAKTETAAALKPFIDPPAQSMDISSNVFTCNNQHDSTFVYNTGSLIHVPQSAFADEKGNDISGKIEIRYREFHDPIDIMLSGIPMNYDSAGIHYQLESAGMFEITAYQNGQLLKLKPGKEISVNMASHTNNENDYNIYYLDTVKRQWDYISENTGKNKTCIPVFEKDPEFTKKFESNFALKVPDKPVLPKMGNPAAYNFIIDFKKNEFPELAVYKGLKLEPVENKKKFHSGLAQKTWDDVMIERENDNEHYIIKFSSERESQSIRVIPVVDEKNYAGTMKDYEKRQKQYEGFLAVKKKAENEKRDSLYRIKEIFTGVASRANLNERFNNFIDDSYTETSKDLLAYRTFAVSKLGVWNSDKPFEFFNAGVKHHKAQFVSVKKELIILKNVYVIKRQRNSIITIPEKNFQDFPFENGINIIVGIGYNNQLFYMKDEDIKNVDAGKEVIQLKMRQTEGVNSCAGLKQLLKI